MKRLSLLIALCLLTGFAQAQRHHHSRLGEAQLQALNFRPAETAGPAKNMPEYKMTEYYSDDGYDIVRFHYDAEKVIAVYQYYDGDELYDSLRYNDQGQLVRLEGYQWLHEAWTNVYYIEYTYDPKGNLGSRTNYNYDFTNEEWDLGGTYTYQYNEDDNIILSILSTQYGGILTQTQYIYNASGNLEREIWSNAMFGGGLAVSEIFHSFYQNNRLSFITDTTYDYYDGTTAYAGKEEFQYDADGNCTKYEHIDESGRVYERSEYEYEARQVADTYIPLNPEMMRPLMFQNTNLYTREHWYAQDVDFVLQYVCDYIYNYAGFQHIGPMRKAGLELYPNPAADQITLSAPAGTSVTLYTLTGKTCGTFTTTQSHTIIPLKELPAGTYILKTPDGSGTFIKQ